MASLLILILFFGLSVTFGSMQQVLFVALGGAIGSALRFLVAGAVNTQASGYLPTGTLAVNLIGSLAIGWLWGVFSMQADVPLRLQLFLITGLLGGFTTFSSFSIENWQLLAAGRYGVFLVYLLVSTGGGVALAYLGFRLSGAPVNF